MAMGLGHDHQGDNPQAWGVQCSHPRDETVVSQGYRGQEMGAQPSPSSLGASALARGMTGNGRIPPPQDANAPSSCSTTPAPQTQHQEEGESELIHLQREQTDRSAAPAKDPDL